MSTSDVENARLRVDAAMLSYAAAESARDIDYWLGEYKVNLDVLVARAREEGAREATMRLKNRLIAVQMTLGDLWNRVDTFDPRMAPDLEEVVKLALEPNP
jgi:hypothetical protein